MCPAAYGTINNPSVGAGVPDGPLFRTSCNPALRKRFHISVGVDAPVRPPTIAPLASPVIARAHRARGNPHLPSPKPPLPKGRGTGRRPVEGFDALQGGAVGGGTHGCHPTTVIFVGQGPRALPLRRGKRIPQSRLYRASPL